MVKTFRNFAFFKQVFYPCKCSFQGIVYLCPECTEQKLPLFIDRSNLFIDHLIKLMSPKKSLYVSSLKSSTKAPVAHPTIQPTESHCGVCSWPSLNTSMSNCSLGMLVSAHLSRFFKFFLFMLFCFSKSKKRRHGQTPLYIIVFSSHVRYIGRWSFQRLPPVMGRMRNI